MTAINLYQRLRQLQPEPLIFTGRITTELADGTVLVNADSGGDFVARNPLGIAVGKSVFYQGNTITAEAPDLTYVLIQV